MKKFLCMLLFCPIINFAQSSKEFTSIGQLNFIPVNMGEVEIGHSIDHGNIQLFRPLGLKVVTDNKYLLDSSFISRFRSPSDSSLTRIYYDYDAGGNQILENAISTCFGCSSGEPGKVESEFDEHGNRTKYISYMLTPTNHYIPEFKVEQSFDSGNILKLYSSYVWDSKSDQWINYLKREYIYDDNDKLIEEVHYEWDINSNLWNYYFKIEQRFDVDGNNLLYATYHYNKTTGIWAGDEKKESVFEDKKLKFFVVSNWDESSGDWINAEKTEITNDAASDKIIYVTFRWNEIEKRWDNYNKYDYSFGSNKKIALLISFSVDDDKQWVESFKEEYSYDNRENEILEVRFGWNTLTNQWINEWKHEMDYSSENQLTSNIYYSWDHPTSLWILASKVDFSFDIYGNKIREITYSWDLTNSQWSIYYKFEYFYSLHTFTNKPDQFEIQQPKIYPNPMFERFTLEINNQLVTQCQLFNSKGMLIKTLPVKMGINTFNVSNLQKGMYLLKIETEGEMIVKKLIKN